MRAAVTGAGRDPSYVERSLRSRYDAKEVLLTDSGTSALRLAIAGAVGPLGRVALPAYSCYDVATAAVGAERAVVLYDLDPSTLGPEPQSLSAVLEAGVDALVVAPLYGIPVDVEAIGNECVDAGVLLIEDAAQGAGATFRGRPLGAWGRLSVMSFGRGKGMTGGGGGALLAHDDAGIEIVSRAGKMLRSSGRGIRGLAALVAQWCLARPSLYGIPTALPFLGLGETIYRAPRSPKAMTRAANAVLSRTLDLAAAEAETRRRRGRRLAEAVSKASGFEAITVPEDAEAGYLRFPVLRGESTVYDQRHAEQLGVMPAYPRALCDLTSFTASIANRHGAFGGARSLATRLLTLPTHSLLREGDIAAVENWIEEGFARSP